LTGIRRLTSQPDAFGRESVRRNLLRVVERVIGLLNAKVCLATVDAPWLVTADYGSRLNVSISCLLQQQVIDTVEHRKFAIRVGTALLKTFVALWENAKISWPTRVALAQCVREFLNLDEEDGEDFSEVFLKMLQVCALPLLYHHYCNTLLVSHCVDTNFRFGRNLTRRTRATRCAST
jgi:hypothetical protein